MCYNSLVRGMTRLVVYIGLLLGALVLAACGDEVAPPTVAIPPALTASPEPPSPTAAPPPTLAPRPAPPTGEPDILTTLPAGTQPLAVVKADLDGDGRDEWVVLAGKTGQPAFETIQPLVIAARPAGFEIVWRGQVDFSVAASGSLQVTDLTGDGRAEIIYQNTTKVGGVYAFVYGGSAQSAQHPALTPQGGACAGLGYFCGWSLEIGPPDSAGRRPLISLVDRVGTRQLYRWTGSAFAVAESLTGTPWPTVRPVPPRPTPPPPGTFDVAQGEGVTTVIARLDADLDGDTIPEIAVAYKPLGVDRLYLGIFAFGGAPGAEETYRLVWSVGPLAGTQSQVFKTRDLTGDGHPELLSGQGGAMAAGGTLYVVGHSAAGYAILRPQGGPLAGFESFGTGDYEIRDQGGTTPPLILARSGSDAAQVDTYQWKDGAFQYKP